jgi:nucleotide-binding universal stress UspA family protein
MFRVVSHGAAFAVRKVMTTQRNQIVVGFDFSISAHAALDRAITVAQRSPQDVLHVICALDPHMPNPAVPNGPVDYQYADRIQGALAERIREELAARGAGGIHFFVHARIGKPATEILNLARELGADQIILGTKGLTGVERMVLGSVAERVVREAGCSVEVARSKSYGWSPLLEVSEVEPHHKYVPPHRYWYEDNRIEMRPSDWPLY